MMSDDDDDDDKDCSDEFVPWVRVRFEDQGQKVERCAYKFGTRRSAYSSVYDISEVGLAPAGSTTLQVWAERPAHCVVGLVERFDAVNLCIFQRKSANFRGLVLFCIEADFCNQILIF